MRNDTQVRNFASNLKHWCGVWWLFGLEGAPVLVFA